MRIEWKHSRCITCLRSKELTLEHVIPDSLGGILTSRFLCRDCNSRFGSTFEAAARLAPELRKAVSGLGSDLTQLAEKLERGAEYQSQFGDPTSKAKLRNDGSAGVFSLEDGSLVVAASWPIFQSQMSLPAQISLIIWVLEIPGVSGILIDLAVG